MNFMKKREKNRVKFIHFGYSIYFVLCTAEEDFFLQSSFYSFEKFL